ncbi:MAG: SCP2 sterol-binding domain-containing protein [Bdellovibrionota bacterium]
MVEDKEDKNNTDSKSHDDDSKTHEDDSEISLTKNAGNLDDDKYPERDASEQEALLQEYDEEEFEDDAEIGNSVVEAIVERAKSASEKLQNELKGSVLLEIEDTNTNYSFNWKAGDLKLLQATKEKADCTITLSQRHLAQISRGKLNPQIAMLSDKIKVEGKASLAVFFFNIVAPVPRH